jgi:hypothetical protein
MAIDRFWSDHTIEPKRKFRWVMSFRGVPQWIVKKVSKPNFSLGEAEHNFLNYKFYYPGRVEWSELNLTLVDPIQPDASQTMMQLLYQHGYVSPEDYLNASGPGQQAGRAYTVNKKDAVNSLGGRLFITQLNAEGTAIEEWQVYNPFIKSVSFDELDYEGDDLLNLELTIRYDWARLNPNLGETAAEINRLNSAPGTTNSGRIVTPSGT